MVRSKWWELRRYKEEWLLEIFPLLEVEIFEIEKET